MTDEQFLYKLGETKAEKAEREFTKLHNETALEIARLVGPEAFTLYFALMTFAYGNKSQVFPANKRLALMLNVSEKTIKRWKRDLENAKVIRDVPCYHENGGQTSNVCVFNACFPEVPENWDVFAPFGFVMRKDENGKPYVTPRMAPPGQNCPPGGDKSVRGGEDKTDPPGGTNLSPEEDNKNKTNQKKTNMNNNSGMLPSVTGELPNPLRTDVDDVVVVVESSLGVRLDTREVMSWLDDPNKGLQYVMDKVSYVVQKHQKQPLPMPLRSLRAAIRDNWDTTADDIAISNSDDTCSFGQKRRERRGSSSTAVPYDDRYEAFYALFPEERKTAYQTVV